MAAPLFAVAGGGEELFDQVLIGVGAGVISEGFDLFVGGAEAGQIEIESLGERAFIGFGGGGEGFFFEAGEEEGVDFAAEPLGVFDGGRGEFVYRLEGPPLAAGFDGHAAEGRGGLRGCFGARVVGAGVDPGFEVIDDGLGEFAAGRHLELGVGVFECGEEAGCRDFAEAGFGVEDEFAHRGFELGVVAGEAGLDEDGANLGFEEGGIGGLREEGRGGEQK